MVVAVSFTKDKDFGFGKDLRPRARGDSAAQDEAEEQAEDSGAEFLKRGGLHNFFILIFLNQTGKS